MGLLDDIMLGIEVFSGGVGQANKQESQQTLIAEAHRELQQLGLPAANDIAQLLQEDPSAADQFVTQRYGGWPEMFEEFQKQSQARSAAEALRAAGGGATVSPAVRSRREFGAGQLAAGNQLPTAGQLTSLFPGPMNAASLGITPGQFTPESVQAAVDMANGTSGRAGYDLLVPIKDSAGKVPEGMKIPTGYFYDPTDPAKPVKPIPGTNAETDAAFNAIMSQIRAEGALNSKDSLDDFFIRHPEHKAFWDAYLRKSTNPLERALAAMLAPPERPGRPAPRPGTNPRQSNNPSLAPSSRVDALRDELP